MAIQTEQHAMRSYARCLERLPSETETRPYIDVATAWERPITERTLRGFAARMLHQNRATITHATRWAILRKQSSEA